MMEDFDFIKRYTYREYPTGQILWKAIHEEGEYREISREVLAKAGKAGFITAQNITYISTDTGEFVERVKGE